MVNIKNSNVYDLGYFLNKYDKIYCSTTLHSETLFLKPILDYRWYLGGPSASFRNGSTFREQLNCNIVNVPFEDLLNINISSNFFSYWDSLLNGYKNLKVIKYSAICSKTCYWNKCKFCAMRVNLMPSKSENISGRNVTKVLSQLPDYKDKLAICYIACCSVTPQILKDVIDYQKYHKRENYIYQFQARLDNEIIDVLNEADDLSNFIFGIGLEYPVQEVVDEFDKNLNVLKSIHALKMMTDKGAKCLVFFLNNITFLNQNMFNEAMNNLDWMEKNINPLRNSGIIFHGDKLDKDDLNLNPKDIILKHHGVRANLFDIDWLELDKAKNYGEFKELRTNSGNTMYRNILTNETLKLNSSINDRIKTLFVGEYEDVVFCE